MSYVTELKATYSHVDSQPLPNGLRIMTSNVLNQNDPTSIECPLDYKERAEILSFYYRYFKADSIGLQEVTKDFLCELLSHLEDEYAYLDVDTHGSKNYTPIIYRKALYVLSRVGLFILR